MKRRWWIVLGSAAFAAIALLVGLSVFFGDPINQQNCDKIKSGMTEAEVEKILGPPSETTDVSRFNVGVKCSFNGEWVERRQKSEQTWKGKSGTISVCFVEGGIVAHAGLEQTDETLLQKMRQWLGLDPPPDWEAPYLTPPGSDDAVTLPD